MQLSVAEDFLRNIESFTIAIGDVLEANSTENAAPENRTVTVTRDNIGRSNICNSYNAHTYQAKPECPILLDVLCIPKIFDYGSAASTFWLRSAIMNRHRHVMENFGYASLMF